MKPDVFFMDMSGFFIISLEKGEKSMDNTFQKILNDINNSTKTINILVSDNAKTNVLKKIYKINSKSLLAVLLENTGGIIIDHWIRFYGIGEINFISRNNLCPFHNIVIAEDILGGLFMFLQNGNIGYFAPDCLELEDMKINLSQFLYWCLHGDTDTFYKDYRWKGWQKDVSNLKNNEGVAFYPFLWARAENLESRHREIVPIDEIICLEFDFLKQREKKPRSKADRG